MVVIDMSGTGLSAFMQILDWTKENLGPDSHDTWYLNWELNKVTMTIDDKLASMLILRWGHLF